jgi:CBS domain-containing protein
MSLLVTQVRDAMTSGVVAVRADAPLADVLRTLEERDVSCVLVTDDAGAPAGVVSVSDLLRVAERDTQGRDTLRAMPAHLRARDVMKTDLAAVDETSDVGEAASKMLHRKVHRVFVRGQGGITGVFSTKDAMRVVLFRLVQTPLAEVMTSPALSVEVSASIDDALAKLGEANVRGIVIVDRGNAPVGVFTQLEAIRARALSPELRRRPVEDVMSYETMALDAATPLYRAAGQAAATRVRRILVTEGGSLAGIVTGYDLARVLVQG